VDFGNSTYGMQTHGDRAHFIVSGLGAGPSAANTWLAADSGRTLRIGPLVTRLLLVWTSVNRGRELPPP
jgi:hypothetical protein